MFNKSKCKFRKIFLIIATITFMINISYGQFHMKNSSFSIGSTVTQEATLLKSSLGQAFAGVLGDNSKMQKVGFWYTYCNLVCAIQDIDNQFPLKFQLFQNFPNPFNPTTTIRFTLPSSEFVTVEIFNMLGQRVHVLANQQMLRGRHELKFSGNRFSSGMYIYVIKAGKYSDVKRMVLLK